MRLRRNPRTSRVRLTEAMLTEVSLQSLEAILQLH